MSWFLGLGGGYYHDSSACLLHDGRIVAFAEEERFSRRKHNADSRSCAQSVAYCLHEVGVELADIDGIAVGWNAAWPAPRATLDDSLARELLGPHQAEKPTAEEITVMPHHLAHAASAFYCSGFDDAAVVVADGSGDGVSTTVWHGSLQGLRLLREYPFTQSLGWFYETAAQHVGFASWTDSGKLMGLASYGRDKIDIPFVRPTADGYEIDLSRYGLSTAEDQTDHYGDLSYYRRLKAAYRRAFTDVGVPARQPVRAYDAERGVLATHTAYTSTEMDLAASAQSLLERCLLAVVRDALHTTGSSTLCLAGGVALNCSANGVLRRESGARELFVQPAAGDSGLAIGAALELAWRMGKRPADGGRMISMALGPSFSDESIGQLLAATGVRAEHVGDGFEQRVAEHIAAGRVVGWFQGRMEGGPRALGQRSILGDPTSTEVRDRINRDIKRREMWRPLAPSLLRSAADRYVLDPADRSDFMIVAHGSTGKAADDIPGVVHVDGSLRPQIVENDADTPYARLLTALEAGTGFGVTLNTSFNHEAEPIVSSPLDALRTFFSTPIDVLSIGGHLVQKQ